MSRYSEILGINADALQTLGNAYFGYAGSLSKGEDSINYPYIASCYTISAILRSLFEPRRSAESFKLAASYYKRDKNNYWLICSVCANDTEQVSDFLIEHESNQEISFLERILASAFINDHISDDIRFPKESISTGRLNIPSKIYIDALYDVSDLNKKDLAVRPFDNIQTFLKRSSESVYMLREDSFHWQNLLGSFVPLEPEVLAFCIVLCKKLRNSNLAINQILHRNRELDPISSLPLQIADEICRLQNDR